jgi:hypothetical protein
MGELADGFDVLLVAVIADSLVAFVMVFGPQPLGVHRVGHALRLQTYAGATMGEWVMIHRRAA